MNRYKQSLLLIIVLFFTACNTNKTIRIPSYYGPQPIVTQNHGRAALPDSSLYEGEFKDGLFHGKGTLIWPDGERYEGEFDQGLWNGNGALYFFNGDVYRGEFVDGSFSGQGKMSFKNGDRYEGEFKNGNFNGQGVFTTAAGDQYSGEFVNSIFSGQGRVISNGNSYEGAVKNWLFDGEGLYQLVSGKKYQGQFKAGVPNGNMVLEYDDGDRYEGGMDDWDQFHGTGRYTMASGDEYDGQFEHGVTMGVVSVQKKSGKERYKGELKDWQYHGKGTLTTTDGNRYKGELEHGYYHGQGSLTIPELGTYTGKFVYGSYHGEGVLEYTDKKGRKKRVAGLWESGKYVGDDALSYVDDGFTRLDAEQILFKQPQQIAQVLQKLAPQLSGQTDLYFISFGSYGSQDVFMNEVMHSSRVMEELYGTGERTIKLINNLQTLDQYPLATTTNLQAVLGGVAAKMDVEEDMLFLYLTSHGSKDHMLSIDMEDLPLQGMSAVKLKQLIDGSGIKWKVILVSACYSGGFIDILKDDYSLIITSARADRTSFGCSNDTELTYFGQAYFKESLKQSKNFIQAFEVARESVTEIEEDEEFKPSMPQIYSGLLIEAKLNQLKRMQR